MNAMDLALFRFKCLEGVLEHWKPIDHITSQYQYGSRRIIVSFNITANPATADIISEDGGKHSTEVVEVSKLIDRLRILGLVKERSDNRHSSSFIKYNGTLI